MTERTEEDKILQTGITVILGGKEYEVRPLVIQYSVPWRKKFATLMATLPKYAKVRSDTPDEFGEAIKMLLVDAQDAVIDLVFDYARELDRNEIESVATEAEIAIAFNQIVVMAISPLALSLPNLGRQMEAVKAQ